MTRLTVALALALAACGSPKHSGDDAPETDALVECDSEGMHRCQGSTYQTCSAGVWQTAVDCPVACVDSLGCVQCAPGQSFCQDGNVWSCDDGGNPGSELQECTGQTTCIGGSCADACADAASSKSYIGCEYWAVDLDNAIETWGVVGEPLGQGFTMSQSFCTQVYSGTITALNVCYESQGQSSSRGACDPPSTMGGPAVCPAGYACSSQQTCVSNAQSSPFAIVISNPQSKDVNVTLTGPGGEIVTKVVAAGTVSSILPQASNAIPDQSVDGSNKALRAYKLTSDLPIVAYQFNPLDNANVFSNDASLLLPRTVFDSDYYVMTMATLDRRAVVNSAASKDRYHGYLTVVAWEDGTQVEVTPTVPTTASATLQSLAAGAPTVFTLNAHEVLQLQAAAAGDLTGTHITSPNMKTFGVFGGHEAVVLREPTPPDSTHTSPCCADHLEEMIFPSTTWGKTFAIARSESRMTGESDTLRVMAQKPNTTVSFVPPPASGTCGTLAPGGFCEVKIQTDTEVTSNEPILVGHFLQSAIWSTPPGTPGPQQSTIGTGDPSMAIAPPVEQFRKDYTILVPDKYEQNYVSIAVVQTGGVTHTYTATNPITMMPELKTDQVMPTGFPGSPYRVARIAVGAGQHKFTCADGCGITVYGWSSGGVSYMFAGGLDLKPIVIL